MKKITDMTNEEAKRFLLKNKSYFSLDLPLYFDFNELLLEIDKKLAGEELKSFYKNNKNNPPKKMKMLIIRFYIIRMENLIGDLLK